MKQLEVNPELTPRIMRTRTAATTCAHCDRRLTSHEGQVTTMGARALCAVCAAEYQYEERTPTLQE